MTQPGRSTNPTTYRHGFNGMEADNDVKTDRNHYSTFFRQYDPRIGRWFSNDPVIQPWQSPYCSMDNNPIAKIDPLGNTTGWYTDKNGDLKFDKNINSQKDLKNAGIEGKYEGKSGTITDGNGKVVATYNADGSSSGRDAINMSPVTISAGEPLVASDNTRVSKQNLTNSGTNTPQPKFHVQVSEVGGTGSAMVSIESNTYFYRTDGFTGVWERDGEMAISSLTLQGNTNLSIDGHFGYGSLYLYQVKNHSLVATHSDKDLRNNTSSAGASSPLYSVGLSIANTESNDEYGRPVLKVTTARATIGFSLSPVEAAAGGHEIWGEAKFSKKVDSNEVATKNYQELKAAGDADTSYWKQYIR